MEQLSDSISATFTVHLLGTSFQKRGLSIAGAAGTRGILGDHGWIRKFARMDGQRPELWAFQPPSRRAKRSRWPDPVPRTPDLAAARREKTIALAALEMPRFLKIVSSQG